MPTHGNRAVYVLPKQFAEYMRQAGAHRSSRSAGGGASSYYVLTSIYPEAT